MIYHNLRWTLRPSPGMLYCHQHRQVQILLVCRLQTYPPLQWIEFAYLYSNSMIRFSPSPPNHSKKEIDKNNYSKYCSLKFHCEKSLVLICLQIYTTLSDIWCKFSFFMPPVLYVYMVAWCVYPILVHEAQNLFIYTHG